MEPMASVGLLTLMLDTSISFLCSRWSFLFSDVIERDAMDTNKTSDSNTHKHVINFVLGPSFVACSGPPTAKIDGST